MVIRNPHRAAIEVLAGVVVADLGDTFFFAGGAAPDGVGASAGPWPRLEDLAGVTKLAQLVGHHPAGEFAALDVPVRAV